MIDRETIQDVADNARLAITGTEAGELEDDFSEILGSFASLDDIDTRDVEPAFHPVDGEADPREDEEEDCFTPEETFSNTDNEEGGFFKGPRAT